MENKHLVKTLAFSQNDFCSIIITISNCIAWTFKDKFRGFNLSNKILESFWKIFMDLHVFKMPKGKEETRSKLDPNRRVLKSAN